MNCVLTRQQAYANGIFGSLADEQGNNLSYTLEHAFVLPEGGYGPKLAVGTYTCVLGQHQLLHGSPFQTFEVKGVPDFQGKPVTGILFHCGNFNQDSEGCILLGTIHAADWTGILGSRADFAKFMALQGDATQFTLVVK